uniref:VWFA domain-containing protein n=1 Tax=Moniliophthora roreri TaxID=221103 RepID=A0A0W0FSZ7_MONRR
MRQQTTDNMLETLRKYDTVIIVDDSSSMIGARWAEAASALSALADLAGQFDADGIDIHFLNDDSVGKNMTKRKAVENLFNQVRPRGVTPIGEKLEDLLRDYLGKLEAAYDSGNPKSVKPVNFVILTDADDPESVIVQAARRLDAKNFPLSQVGIQFVQIGKSAGAAQYLRELDDNLVSRYHIRDIVDTTKYIGKDLSADALVKILLGGINRRVDNKGVEVFNEDVLKDPIRRLEGPY